MSNRILASVVAILVLSTVIGFALSTLRHRSELGREYQQRALAIAETFAAMPPVRVALARDRLHAPASRIVQALAREVRRETGATYIVAIDRHGIRYSHPDPRLIGRRVSEPVLALDGRDHLGVDHGRLGPSAAALTPLRAPDGRIVGEVSAGIQERAVSSQLLRDIPGALLYFLIALAIGVVASITLGRRLKRDTFGLELDEIAGLLQEREAVLHSIGDGLITLDRADRVTLVNDEAARLLGVGDVTGRHVSELTPPGRLRDLMCGAGGGSEQPILTDEHMLVVQRMTVRREGRELGSVITLRDRTEMEGLLRELDGVDALTDALRAQQHEFSNRMHTIAGLIELGEHDAAVGYALDVSNASGGLAEVMRERVERPEIAAMLLAKTTIAAERDIKLVLSPESRLADDGLEAATLVSIVGNLIDNALEAAAAAPAPRVVEISLGSDDGSVRIEVRDSGPGVPPELRDDVFRDGFSTKPQTGDRHRGLGLALVHRLVLRHGGRIWIDGNDASRFCVVLPVGEPARQADLA